MDGSDVNFTRAGHYFICTVWVQSQLTNLISLAQNTELIPDFVSTPSRIPEQVGKKRIELWEESLTTTISDFKVCFPDHLTAQFIQDLNTINHIRNAIAHSHISLGRPYLLYRPQNQKKEDSFIKDLLVLSPEEDKSEPTVFKIDFSNDEIYYRNFEAISRIDQVHIPPVAESLGIPHSRIR